MHQVFKVLEDASSLQGSERGEGQEGMQTMFRSSQCMEPLHEVMYVDLAKQAQLRPIINMIISWHVFHLLCSNPRSLQNRSFSPIHPELHLTSLEGMLS